MKLRLVLCLGCQVFKFSVFVLDLLSCMHIFLSSDTNVECLMDLLAQAVASKTKSWRKYNTPDIDSG